MYITNNRRLAKYINPYVHHKQQKIAKYTNPYVHHKQQKISKIYKSKSTSQTRGK